MLTINPMITTNGSIKPSGLSLVKANGWSFLVFILVRWHTLVFLLPRPSGLIFLIFFLFFDDLLLRFCKSYLLDCLTLLVLAAY